MTTHVNLDALIIREDFEIIGQGDEAPTKTSLQIRELESTEFFFTGLRKPDFQRETSEWDPNRIVGLIKSFVDDQLIPAIILWKNKDMYFVIDGSHRLSALVAWVQDDYGDGTRSQSFFGPAASEEQIKIAQKTRDIINKEIGSYQDHRKAASNPEAYGPDIVARARRLATTSLQIQWVRGDATKAEDSFIRINQQAANITPQELELIKSRKKPNAIATRAIIQRGNGHRYWSLFDKNNQDKIMKLASEIHSIIFEPSLRYPIKTLDLPLGGAVYTATALRMVYDFINLSTGTPSQEDDINGSRTVNYLLRSKRVAQLILSNEPHSLGLHPAIYFYSWTGKQQPILFLSISSLIVEMERSKSIDKFIESRMKFENFLITNRTLVNQVVRKYGTKSSGSKHLISFYQDIIEIISSGTQSSEIAIALKDSKPIYSYLQPDEVPYDGVSPTKFSTQVKSGIIIQELLKKAPVCSICGGIIPQQSISIDHIKRREDGGLATTDNSQITHPYCNTGYKEKRAKSR